MRSVDYHGYTIYEDGTIVGLYGKKIKQRINDGRYEVRINIEGKRINYISSRLIYHAFYPFDINNKDLCITYRDNDKLNIHLDNLYLTERKNLIQGDKHRAKSKITDKQAEEIRRLYTGKKSVNQYDESKGYSYQDLADMYGVSKSNIMWIVKEMSRNKDKYKLK